MLYGAFTRRGQGVTASCDTPQAATFLLLIHQLSVTVNGLERGQPVKATVPWYCRIMPDVFPFLVVPYGVQATPFDCPGNLAHSPLTSGLDLLMDERNHSQRNNAYDKMFWLLISHTLKRKISTCRPS
eukprot:3771865-Amphidinium_carterae.5